MDLESKDKSMLISLESPAEEKVMWLLILAIYVAPPDSVDWKGPWELGLANLIEERFGTEAGCLNAAIQIKAKLNEGMLAPVRFHCVNIDAALPAGAPR